MSLFGVVQISSSCMLMISLVVTNATEATLPDKVVGYKNRTEPVTEDKVDKPQYIMPWWTVLEEIATASGAQRVTEDKVDNRNKLGNDSKLLEEEDGTEPVTEDKVDNPQYIMPWWTVLEEVATANGAQRVTEDKVDDRNKLGNNLKLLEEEDGTELLRQEVANENGTQNVTHDKVDNYMLGNYLSVLKQAAIASGAEPSTVRDSVQTVHMLEFFSSEIDFSRFLHKMARLHHASIMRTNKEVFGKRVRKYHMQYVLPQGAVIVSCHSKKNCTKACDKRFSDDSNFVSVPPSQPRPSLRGGRPAFGSDQTSWEIAWGLCHSPPTTSQMVYTQAEFEDDSVEWLMWACHVEHLTHKMCHPIEVVVVDPASLRAAVRHAA